jgi:hypothetical protein
MSKNDYGLHLDKIKKRKLKKGETDYPQYEFKTIEDIFNALTPENMNRFFKDFKTAMAASVHLRELTYLIAKEKVKKEGVELEMKPQDAIKMPSFTWIDD